MKFKLTHNWKEVVTKAWSIKLILLAGLLTAAEAILPYFEVYLPNGLFLVLLLVVISGAFVARLLAQSSLYK
jgi:hypothetical protein